jgi:class 3 adenylate cyclase
MSTQGESPKISRKIVVVFDICSSTSILEDLLRTENHEKWTNFLIRLKEHLVELSKTTPFILYKFLGDGYILLFEEDYSSETLYDSLRDLCIWFDKDYSKNIKRFLESPPKVSGITFGIDRGSLIKLVMQSRDEYIGRAINVAARLQRAIGYNDEYPSSKGLVASHYYSSTKSGAKDYEVVSAKRQLKNIADGSEVTCFKITLLKSEKEQDT